MFKVYKKEPAPNVQNVQNGTDTKCTNVHIEEIRLRSNKPLMLKIGQETQIIDFRLE